MSTATENLTALQRTGADPDLAKIIGAYSGPVATRRAQAADDGWRPAGSGVVLLGLVAGLVAALAVWAGMAPRLREYR